MSDRIVADRPGGDTRAEPRRGLVLGARIASGVVAAGVAVAVVGVVTFAPFPTLGSEPRAVTVEPAPADRVRVCPGGALRLGDASGADADAAFSLGAATHDGAVRDGELERIRLASADPAAPPAAAPELLLVPPADGAQVAGAQTQDVDAPDFRGLTAASCAEPSGSTWLVGGATTVGRSSVVLLVNPSDVPSQVTLRIFGEDGPVSAPGMTGIAVPAGGQRVVSLAGFAPGLESPVVHVTARGGRVVAALQQSIVRGLDAVGVETIGGGADPAEALVIPGVRIVDAVGANRASALADWHDVGPIVRIAVPGETAGRVTVRVVPDDAGEAGHGTSFELEAEAGSVLDIPLDAGAQTPETETPETQTPGAETDDHDHGLQDGAYTVFVDADVPVVAAVRASTAVDSGVDPAPDAVLDAPPSDLAWFSAAPALEDSTFFVVAAGPSPLLTLANRTTADVEVDLVESRSGEGTTVTVPAGGSVSLPMSRGAYVLAGATGLAAAVTFAAPGALAAYVLAPDRPVAGPLVVHPD